MHILTDTAISVLANAEEQPIFIWLSLLHPHTPYMPVEPYFSMYNDIDIPSPVKESNGLTEANKPFRQIFHKENNDRILPYDDENIMRMKRNYYGMVTMVDAEIGRILDFLESNKMLENTLILFTSDHGDYMGDHGMVTKSPSMYDCLTRVPMIWYWKGQLKSRISNELISNVDVMPTLLSLLGQNIPEQVQGVDYANYLTGKDKSFQPREYVYSEYGIPGTPLNRETLKEQIPNYKEKPIFYSDPNVPWEANPVALAGRFRMIRSKDWKFVQELGGTNELYDMKNDPNELVNLIYSPEYEGIRRKLENDLNKWKATLPEIDKDSTDMSKYNIDLYNEGKRVGMSKH
jgi:arylsulfatase A-like enzyme